MATEDPFNLGVLKDRIQREFEKFQTALNRHIQGATGSRHTGDLIDVSGDQTLQQALDNITTGVDRTTGKLVSELRLQIATLPVDSKVFLRGYSTPNDGGEGTFTIVSGSYTDNGGTILVAGGYGATESKAAVRDKSGYVTPPQFGAVGDGLTDDTVAIQRCFNAAVASEGTRSVLLTHGTYKVTSSLSVTSTAANPLLIAGTGNESHIVATIAGTGSALISTGSEFSNFTIRDLRLSGAFSRGMFFSATSGNNVRIERCNVSGATVYDGVTGTFGIAVGGLDDVWIVDNELSGNGVHSTGFTPKTFTVDAGTDVLTSTGHGLTDTTAIQLETTGTLPTASGGNLAVKTTYYVRDATSDTLKLARTSGGAAIDITNTGTGVHKINSGTGYGADIYKLSGNLQSRVHVNGNKVTGQDTAAAIMLFDVADSEITNNTIDQGNTPLALSPNVTQGYGVTVYSLIGGSVQRRNITANNRISNCSGLGVYYQGQPDSSVIGNILKDTCKQITEPSLPLAAISLNGQNATVTGNNIKTTNAANGCHAIAITGANTTVVGNHGDGINAGVKIQGDADSSSISGNTFTNCVHGVLVDNSVNPERVAITGNSIETTGAGLDVQTGSTLIDSTFCNNVVSGAQTGFYLVTGCVGNRIANNVFKGGSDYAVDILSGADSNLISGNIVRSNTNGIRVASDNCHIADNDLSGVSTTPLSVTGARHVQQNNRVASNFVGARVLNGTSSPESAITGNVGDMFARTDGGADTTLYIKQSGTGNTGWAPVYANSGDKTFPGDIAYAGGRVFTDEATVQTTDATVTTALAYNPADSKVIRVFAVVFAVQNDNSDMAVYERKATFETYTASNPTQIGTTQQLTDDESAGAAAWDVTIDASGSDIRVRVTGQASQTIDWRVHIQVALSS